MRLVLYSFFLIKNWTINQHYPLQSRSFGKPHTAGDVAPTPGSSAGSVHVELPSAGLLRHFGCCPQFQNDDLWGGIWVSGKGNFTWAQIRRVWGLRSHWNTLSGQKFVHGDVSVTGSVVVMQHPRVRNLWPDTMNPFSESFKDHTLVPIIPSNIDQTSRQPSLWSYFLPFLTCKVFQNEVRLPHSHSHPKMLYAT